MSSPFSRRELLLSAASLLPLISLPTKMPAQTANPPTPEELLAAIEARLGGRLGVCALEFGTGPEFGTARRIDHRSDERFPMCSTFKFVLAAAILTLADKKQIQLDRFIPYTKDDLLEYAPVTRAHLNEGGMTVAALCAAAVSVSDNTAANLLLAQLGGPAQWTRYARSLGDSISRLDRNEPSLNEAVVGDVRDTTSPSAMLGNMKKLLLDAELLSSASRKQLEDWMIANITGAALLRAGLPSAWQIGDKTGSGRNGSTNDIAICRPPNRPPILITTYFVESPAPAAERSAAIAEAARIIATRFA